MKAQTLFPCFACALTLAFMPMPLPAQQTKQPQQKEFGLTKATNLGFPINTSSGEFAPTISADGKTLIFESDREERWEWKLYSTHKTETGWTAPRRLDTVNSDKWDGAPFLTYDQNFLIISSKRSGGRGDVDIWISQRLGENWSKPVNLGSPINTPDYDGFASLASDGKTMYFMRDAARKGECEQRFHFDIYYTIKKGEKWSAPQMLPAVINSEYCETSPVILVDGKTLIFSSNRPGGYGDYDLYKSELQNDGQWSTPLNLGSFINTSEDDRLVSIPASGDVMYFSSGQNNATDIYSVPIPSQSRPTTVITVAGTVKNAKAPEQPLTAKITIIDAETGKDTTLVESNAIDGKYIVILNQGKTYDVSVSCPGFTFYSTQFDLRELETYEALTRDIVLEPLAAGVKIVLNNIYFEVDSYTLLEESQYELQRATQLMNDNPSMQVEIAAHTDSTGSESYNLNLSNKRAESVINFLIAHGVAPKRLLAQGYGESRPIAGNDTEEGRKQNRRIEFQITEITALKD